MSLGQLKVMSAIESCRTAALGGHVARCEDCSHTLIAYNSCRNRHCPKCQGAAAREWLADREAELLPVPYYHVVFTLPAPIADIAYQNKAVIYDLLFKVSAETLITIAADPKHLGARDRHHLRAAHLGLGAHPSPARPHDRAGRRHLAGRRSAGSPAGRASSCPCACSRACFAGCSWSELVAAHEAGRLNVLRRSRPRSPSPSAFAAYLAPLRKTEWVVYAKRPFGGPEAVLAYLSRYTHRVAISNSRLIALDDNGVTFKWKDYRIEGRDRYKRMTLAYDEFIRRFLIHVLPDGFHRIRHYGLFASGSRADNLARARQLLAAPTPQPQSDDAQRHRAPMNRRRSRIHARAAAAA